MSRIGERGIKKTGEAVMKLIEWLRKLGILRFGGEAGVYRNAKERPLSFQMDDVCDSQKDVIDLNKKKRKAPPDASQPEP
jgi:hypothetical protein